MLCVPLNYVKNHPAHSPHTDSSIDLPLYGTRASQKFKVHLCAGALDHEFPRAKKAGKPESTLVEKMFGVQAVEEDLDWGSSQFEFIDWNDIVDAEMSGDSDTLLSLRLIKAS